jgi:hypothetical protein
MSAYALRFRENGKYNLFGAVTFVRMTGRTASPVLIEKPGADEDIGVGSGVLTEHYHDQNL